jgi:hypothetical protein
MSNHVFLCVPLEIIVLYLQVHHSPRRLYLSLQLISTYLVEEEMEGYRKKRNSVSKTTKSWKQVLLL